ncbi:hypothetical protein [Catellatospora tritici]|uniref:hypothetical protein n=1 Tax=Catellatospora tritici TaxID=2851566 RepID=UPI001C2D0E60|nr:hypothetical protein [Catellatospora tritici]MBV1849524.1 hypothetical protein [Catellatospora tritici]MBV1854096.1 hypothetical protein [Catellatospora tritici]
MRHVWSLLAAIVITPLAWAAAAQGQAMLAVSVSPDVPTGMWVGLAVVAGAGLVLGLIGALRQSPVGPLFTALVYLGFTVWFLIQPVAVLRALDWGWKLGGYRADLTLPLQSGLLAAVGALLLVAVFSPSRWRAWPKPVHTIEPAWPQPVAPQYPAQQTLEPTATLELPVTPAHRTGADTPSWSAPQANL